MMHYRSQLSALSVTPEPQVSILSNIVPWTNGEDAKFFRSCLVYDSTQRHPNWNAVLGIGMATAVSAGFWVGIGFTIAYLWR